MFWLKINATAGLSPGRWFWAILMQTWAKSIISQIKRSIFRRTVVLSGRLSWHWFCSTANRPWSGTFPWSTVQMCTQGWSIVCRPFNLWRLRLSLPTACNVCIYYFILVWCLQTSSADGLPAQKGGLTVSDGEDRSAGLTVTATMDRLNTQHIHRMFSASSATG